MRSTHQLSDHLHRVGFLYPAACMHASRDEEAYN